MVETRVPGLSNQEQYVLSKLIKQLNDKRARNLLRSKYYDMKHFTSLVGSVIPPSYAKLGMVLGWAGKAVDILARRCNLEGFVWPDGKLEDLGYDGVWLDNNMKSETDQGLVSSLIHSTAFVVNTVGDKTNDEPAGMIHYRDALSATGTWNTRTRRLDDFLSVHSWKTNEDNESGNVVLTPEPSSFTLYLFNLTITCTQGNFGKWSVDRQEHPWGVPADPLPYRPRLGRPFGSSRISRTVMTLQDQAVRTTIRLEAHSDIYAIPDLWLLGAESSLFRDENGSQKTDWQVRMGRLKAIPDDPDADPALARPTVQQFSASDPTPHLMALKQQAQLFSGETCIPVSSLGVSDQANPTSADSYIASREDLISEAEGATDDWTPAVRRAMLRALAMSNGLEQMDPTWSSIQPKWRSPVHLSRASAADAGSKQISGAPWLAETEVGLELLGLTDQQVDRALSDKARAQGQQALAVIARAGLNTPPAV